MKICKVCKSPLADDKNDKCNVCGFYNTKKAISSPRDVIYPNIACLNSAKSTFAKNKKITTSFEDLLKIVDGNLEPTFFYAHKKYGITNFDDGYQICEYETGNQYQNYKTIQEFAQNSKVDGKLLKDVWQQITKFELGC